MFKHYDRNTKGRDLIVGDIHGCFSSLGNRLQQIKFNPEVDRLFSVGDLVDRGPESAQVLEMLAKPWFHPIRGNHEQMAIDWVDPSWNMSAGNYAANGGAWNIANSIEEREEIAQAFKELPIAIEIETEHGLVGVVHAGCPCDSWADFRGFLTDSTLTEQSLGALSNYAMWSRERIDKGETDLIDGVRMIFVGHTPVRVSQTLGNHTYIDTGGWMPGWTTGFTIVDAATLLRV